MPSEGTPQERATLAATPAASATATGAGGAAPLRLGIVGVGWGANHARVAAELGPRLVVSALCSRHRERLAPLAAELNLPERALEQSWERLVARDDVDLVVVTAPDSLHHPITMAAIANGKHVFCDKPLAMDVPEAREMLAAAEAAGVAHFTGFTWRFAPPFATIRRLLDQGDVGEVRFIDGHFRIGPPLPGKEWQLDPASRAGGVLGNVGVHLIDLARYLGGIEGGPVDQDDAPWWVWADCRAVERALPPDAHERVLREPIAGTWPALGAQAARDPSVNDAVWLQLEMGPLRVRLQASQTLTLRAPDPVRVEVHGTRASVTGYANPLQPHTQRVTRIERTSQTPQPVEPLDYPGDPPAPPTATLPSGGLLRPTIKHLYEAHILPRLTGDTPATHTPTFRDGLIAQQVLAAALRSAAADRWEAV